MSYRTVAQQLALLALLLSGIMAALALLFLAPDLLGQARVDRAAAAALLVTGGVGTLLGGGSWWLLRGVPLFVGRKEALLLVAASWIGGALMGAMPYWLWAIWGPEPDHPFRLFVNCYFESMSGLTTTGASVLSDIESLPRSLLLWRAMTHWLGGLGIVVLFVAVLPGLGVGGKRLFQVESPGPAPEGLQPHIRETARWLWFIYLGLTLAQFTALLLFTPMNAFQAICHTLATLATGGFSTMNASTGAFYHTPAVDAIVIAFMVLAGVNFGLYFRMCRGRWDIVARDHELRVYLGTIALATLLVAGAVYVAGDPIVVTTGEETPASVGATLRNSLFTAVSAQTTTGFCTNDFERWPFLAQAVLILVMFVGGSSGSTGGGIKVIRIWIVLKVLWAEIERAFRPSVVRPLRVGRTSVDPEVRMGAVVYTLGFGLLFVLGAVAIMLCEQAFGGGTCDFTTAATGCVATLCNIGPGFGAVGAVDNYAWLAPPTKALMCVLMALGRLEVFAIVVLFSRGFWQRS